MEELVRTPILATSATRVPQDGLTRRHPGPRARILVVDDNADVLESFRKILVESADRQRPDLQPLEAELFGSSPADRCNGPTFSVELFSHGEEACRRVAQARSEKRRYALAFVDMRMPSGWDGLRTIEELWRIDPAIQIVICTAYSDHSWTELLDRLGRSDHLLILRKPFEAIEVRQLAHALTSKWRLQRLQEARLVELERKVDSRVAELHQANRTLRMLSRCNEALVRATDEGKLLRSICTDIVRIGGYRLAWVGYRRDDTDCSIEPMAHAGTDRDYVDRLNLTWGPDERRRGVGGTAVREGRPTVARQISTDPVFETWRGDALSRGLASCIALPLRSKNGVLGTLSIYSGDPDAFDRGETKLLIELADDLAYGISSLRETQQRKRVERELERQARFDALTGLANRATLEGRATQALLTARAGCRKAAMIFIDLDRLKRVNDTLGHSTGDRLLVEVARRLSATVRESDTVARLAGDEFVVFLDELRTATDAASVAAKLVAVLGDSYQVDHHEIRVSASIGVSMHPDDGDDVQALLRSADTAMYSAKALGGNGFRFFSPEMNARLAERYKMEADLRRAIQADELCVHFQPQVSLSTGAITGAEALVRWQHPGKGMVSPIEFIPLAEETGLIHSLGEWVIKAVCAQCRQWLDAGLPVPTLAVNLSPRQFHRENLVAMIEQAIAANRLDPDQLDLEITESAVMHDVDAAAVTVKRLKAIGVRISLDDFGTGYSSLSHLKRFSIDRLKIDRSFVRHVTTDPGDTVICNAIIGLAHNLNLTVIAEGVETVEHLHYLRERKCDEIQGYLFSPPVPPSVFARMLQDGRALELPLDCAA